MSKIFKVWNALRENVLKKNLTLMLVASNITLTLLNYTATNLYLGFNSTIISKSVSVEPIFFFFAFGFILNMIEFINGFIESLFTSDIISAVFTNKYREFLNIRWADWKSYIDAEIYYAIIRNSTGAAGVLRYICLGIFETVVWNIFAIFTIGKKTTFIISAYILGIFFFYIFLNTCLLVLKSRLRYKCNCAFDTLESLVRDILTNYEMILLNNTLDQEIRSFDKLLAKFSLYFKLLWTIGTCSDLVKTFIFLFGNTFFYIKSDEICGGDITKVIFLASLFNSSFKSVTKLTGFMEKISMGLVLFCGEKFSDLEKETQICDLLSDFNSEITVKNLEFSFKDKKVFENVKLTIKKGSKIAITGANGAGKSTFIKILIGMLKYKGDIEIDNKSLCYISKKSLSKIFSYIPQNPMLFNASILENLRCFDRSISEDFVVKKCMEFNIHHELKAIGYDFVINDGVNNISAVLAQKISFLRAIIRDTPVIVIDELTSMMSQEIEMAFIEKMLVALKEKTIIVIVHNLKLLKLFETVIFFSKNSSIDHGSFDKLYSENETFRNYFDSTVYNKTD